MEFIEPTKQNIETMVDHTRRFLLIKNNGKLGMTIPMFLEYLFDIHKIEYLKIKD